MYLAPKLQGVKSSKLIRGFHPKDKNVEAAGILGSTNLQNHWCFLMFTWLWVDPPMMGNSYLNKSGVFFLEKKRSRLQYSLVNHLRFLGGERCGYSPSTWILQQQQNWVERVGGDGKSTTYPLWNLTGTRTWKYSGLAQIGKDPIPTVHFLGGYVYVHVCEGILWRFSSRQEDWKGSLPWLTVFANRVTKNLENVARNFET